MSYVSKKSSTDSSITVVIRKLTYETQLYDGFRYRVNNGSWMYQSSGSTTYLDGHNDGYYTSPNFSISSLSCGTSYTIEGEAQWGGVWYSSTSLSASTDACPRPPLFSWTYSKSSGNSFNLTSTEWNSLCSNINDVRAYKGFSNYSFTTAYDDKPFYASMFNEARSSITTMSPSISVPAKAYSGDKIYASDLNKLVDSINSVS